MRRWLTGVAAAFAAVRVNTSGKWMTYLIYSSFFFLSFGAACPALAENAEWNCDIQRPSGTCNIKDSNGIINDEDIEKK